MNFEPFADKALKNETLSREACLSILQAPQEALLPLIQAAFKVRKRYFGTSVKLHQLLNAKSGLCPEDCGYCSQSSISTADIDTYTLLSTKEMVSEARKAVDASALRFCIVTSGRGPSERELEHISEAVREIKNKYSIEICCSLGLLTLDQAKGLKAAGVDRINHNLNTSERFYSSICNTHTYQDRIDTLNHARAAGLEICCGGIIGMGETDQDMIDMAYAFRAMDVDSIPVNFLNPIAGTPMEGIHALDPWRCIKVLCLLRFINPSREIRMAGGRELHLRALQPLALYVVDAMFVGGYLTTPGQAALEAQRMIEDMGFHIQQVRPATREAVV